MTNIRPSGERPDAFPQLGNAEYLDVLRIEEAVAALTTYLRQRTAGLCDDSDEKKVYDHNDTFPFPILPTAYEIAELVLKSAGSFGMDRPVAHEPESAN